MPEAPTIVVLSENIKQFVGEKVIAIDGSINEEIKKRIDESNLLNVDAYGKQPTRNLQPTPHNLQLITHPFQIFSKFHLRI